MVTLLLKLLKFRKLSGNDYQSTQLVPGFKKTGIFHFNPDEIISAEDTPSLVSESVIEMLKDLRSEVKKETANENECLFPSCKEML